MSLKRDHQVSVPLDPALRQFVEQQAAREDRTVAGQIRHWLAGARSGSGAGCMSMAQIIGAGLAWKRDGDGWVLHLGRRRFGRVVADAKWPGMFRSLLSGGCLSDMANLTWAKNAVLDDAVRELEWEARCGPATDPRNSQQKRGVFEDAASPIEKTDREAA
jgi:hypothetical protein